MSAARFLSIDMMRALAIVGMVTCHFVIFWSDESRNPLVFFIGNHVLGDWPAPFFTFLVGVSQAVSNARHERKGTPPREITLQSVKRGLWIIGIGCLLNLFIAGPGDVFSWDVLALIGSALILIPLAKHLSTGAVFSLCLGILLISPVLREVSQYSLDWGGLPQPVTVLTALLPNSLFDPIQDYIPGFGWHAVKGYLVNAYFPLFPWIVFPLLGYSVGKAWYTEQPDTSLLGRHPVRIGAICISLGLLIGYGGSLREGIDPDTSLIAPFSFYPATSALVLTLFGLAVWVLVLFRRWFDRENPPAWSETGQRLSRYSLSLYLIHLLLINVPLELHAALDPSSPRLNNLSPAFSLMLGIGFLVLFTRATVHWDRIGGKYSFEWLLAKATGR